jgi:hypothetical protein
VSGRVVDPKGTGTLGQHLYLLCGPRRALIGFTVPFFGGYFRRQHPIVSFDE